MNSRDDWGSGMPDPAVQKWKQRGITLLWKEKGRPSAEWNISCDDQGCDSLLQLLDIMDRSPWSNKREIAITRPIHIPQGPDDRPHYIPKWLLLNYGKTKFSPDHWKLFKSNRTVVLELGANRLDEFRRAITDIRAGLGDYAFGDDGHRLWIWWWLEGCVAD